MANNLEMVFWDVQHGHSTYIKSPNNKNIIVDLGIGSYGSKDEKFSPLIHLRGKYNVAQLDYVIITHPHKDHIDDIFNFDIFNPRVLCRPRHLTRGDIITTKTKETDKHYFEKYLEIDNRYSEEIQAYDTINPSNPDNFGGLKRLIFSPASCARSNLNNHSILAVFEYAQIKVVIPGDNEECSFNELLENNFFKQSIKDSYVLLASHHGSDSGYNEEFVKLVNPAITIISDSSRTESSATDKYSKRSRGWKVHYRDGSSEENKKTLSTYNNGVINLTIGFNPDGRSFLEIKAG